MVWGSVVNASFIDRGNYFTDTKSGLDWLKLTETMEMYVVQVENEMVPGARLDGWRYATIDDLRILISNYINEDITHYDYLDQEVDKIDNLIPLLGSTLDYYVFLQFGLTFSEWQGYEKGRYNYTLGTVYDPYENSFWVSMINDDDYFPPHFYGNGTTFQDDFSIIRWIRTGDIGYSSRESGNFLVRDATNLIPEPPPFILMTFFLLLLMIKTRHN